MSAKRDHKAEWQRRNAKARAEGYSSAHTATAARARQRVAVEERIQRVNERNALWKARLADLRLRP